MTVKTGREEEETNETVKAGRIQRTDKCKIQEWQYQQMDS